MTYVPQIWEDENPLFPPSDVRFAYMEVGIFRAHPTFETALPVTPYDGQEIFYEVAAGLYWHFVYNSTIPGDYKWASIGAQPARAAVATQETITGNLYVNLATAGPLVDAPLAGLYYAVGKATFHTANGLALYTGTLGVGVNDFVSGAAADFAEDTAVQAGNARSTLVVQGEIEAAAGDDIKLRYGVSSNNNMSASKRQLAVWPLRVGIPS